MIGRDDNTEADETSVKWLEAVEETHREIRLAVVEYKKVTKIQKSETQFRINYNLIYTQYKQACTLLETAMDSKESLEAIQRNRDNVGKVCERLNVYAISKGVKVRKVMSRRPNCFWVFLT